MRTGLAIMALLMLQGCGGGADGNSAGGFAQAFEDGFKKSYREKFIEQCASAANQSAAGVDFKPVCACAADRLMANKSSGQLMSGPSEAEQREVLQKCLIEHPLK